MKSHFRLRTILLCLALAQSGCGHDAKKADPAPTPAERKEQEILRTEDAPPGGQSPRPPGADPEDDQNSTPWWMLVGLGAAKPAEQIEKAENLCGKFQEINGDIKLVQTRTRGQRSYRVLFLDPKYKLATHYCFDGNFLRYKVLGGPDFTVFEIKGWARNFAAHTNARKADNLPPLPKALSCVDELLGAPR